MNYDFKSFIHGVKGNAPQFNSCCPFHDDRNPSFSFNIETGLWKCHAGCGAGNYEMFLKMFQSGLAYAAKYKKEKTKFGFYKQIQSKLVAEYFYQNIEGSTCFRVKRYEDTNGSKTFIQESLNENFQWIPKKTTQIIAPYQYEIWKDSSDLILFVEGEKCADFLLRMKFMATTIPGGANAWNDQFIPFFDKKIIRILPDYDVAGAKFGNQVLKALGPVAREVKQVQLPNLLDGGDVYNWFSDDNDRSDEEKLKEFSKLIE